MSRPANVDTVDPLDEVVAATPSLDRPALVAVDGVDGSGKTTFAGQLAAGYQLAARTAHVVHLDDFMNPRAVRYRTGRDSPHGYFRDTYDLAAFSTRVVEPLMRGGDCSITPRAFDYRADRCVQEQPVDVRADEVVIVEGMFLHRDELRETWDVSVFLNVPFTVSVRRMAERDGTSADPDDPALRRYVEGQRLYLDQCQPQQRATFVLAPHEMGDVR